MARTTLEEGSITLGKNIIKREIDRLAKNALRRANTPEEAHDVVEEWHRDLECLDRLT